MLSKKEPLFLKRTIEMIVNWDRVSNSKSVVHIHGNKDKTIPIRNVSPDSVINKGSHMLTLTRGAEITELINQIITT